MGVRFRMLNAETPAYYVCNAAVLVVEVRIPFDYSFDDGFLQFIVVIDAEGTLGCVGVNLIPPAFSEKQ